MSRTVARESYADECRTTARALRAAAGQAALRRDHKSAGLLTHRANMHDALARLLERAEGFAGSDARYAAEIGHKLLLEIATGFIDGGGGQG